MTNSREKGKRGEREAAAELNRVLGWCSRRGQQFCGGTESADLADIPARIHVEVKRVEKLNIQTAMVQAVRDAGDNVPIVVHRRNRGDWLVTVLLDDLPRFVRELATYALASRESDE